jgi:hypothetical protein
VDTHPAYCTGAGAHAPLSALYPRIYDTIARMMLPEPAIDVFRTGLPPLLADMIAAGDEASGTPARRDDSDPSLLAAAFDQLLDVMARSERSQAQESEPAADAGSITEIGEYALELFDQTLRRANDLDLPVVFAGLQAYTIAMARWIAVHGGQLMTLEPVVDAFARCANSTREPAELVDLYGAMGDVLNAASPVIQRDLERSNPGRPWRILHLNRAIVATRTHRPDLMEEAFGSLIKHLPDDAAGFFSQGMEQMDLLNYPPHVRAVMDRYYRKWSINRSLH